MFQGTRLGACCCLVLAVLWPHWFSAYHLHPKVTWRRAEVLHLCLPLSHWWWVPVPAMKRNTHSCFCNVKYLCQQLGCRAAPYPGGLSTPAPRSCSNLGIYATAYSSFPFFPLHLVKCRARKVCVCFCTWLSPQTCLAGGCHMRAGA